MTAVLSIKDWYKSREFYICHSYSEKPNIQIVLKIASAALGYMKNMACANAITHINYFLYKKW